MGKQRNNSSDERKLSAAEQKLKATIQQLQASEQQLKAVNQQLRAAEEELHSRNEFLNNVLEAVAHPFYVVDAKDYTVKLANAAANFGTLMEDSKCYALSHKKSKPCRGVEHPCPLEEAKKTKKPVIVEHIHYDKDGNPRNVEVHAHPIFDRAGKISQMIEYCLDITERKKTEERLCLYGEIITSMSEGVYAIRASDGVVFYTNPKFEEMFGYRPGELIGKHVSVINAPTEKTPEETAAEIIEVLNEKGSWRGEICNIKKDGTPFWCYAGVSIFDHPEHGKVWVSTHTDITERKKAEEQVNRLAKFPSENPNPVLRISKDCTILYANDASSVVLETWGKQIGQRLPKVCCERAEEALSSGKVSTFEFACHDGRIFEVTLAPVVELGYLNVYGLDITERKQAEEALRAINQQLRASEQQLKAANQQLRASEQQLKATNQQLQASEQQLKALASQLTLAEESERHRIATELHATIGQSLAFSKLQLDILRASVPSGDIAKTLGEVCETLDDTIQGTRSLTFDLSSPVLYELGFEKAVAEWLTEQIQQKHRIATEFEDDGRPKPLDDDVRVFLFRDVRELLINVVKHASANKVKVSICRVGRQIQVSVEDDGWGFDPKKVATMAVRKGGFGLFSIRERLGQLGGNLEIESAPGQGAKVTIMAPLKHGKNAEGR